MIPLIDCAAIAEGDFEEVSFENYNEIAKEIGRAMTGIGMCNLINVGVSMEKIEKVHEVSKKFFELPVETKLKYRKVSPKKSFHGYSAPGDEFLNEDAKNSTELREFWDIWGPEAYDEKMYPDDDVPGFKQAIDDVRSELEKAGKKIFRCIEICLELEEGTFTSTHRNLGDHSISTHSQLRSLYYYKLNPNANFPPNAIRCGEHKDWGSITFLIQDMVGGLEVKTSEGEWISAVPVKNAILLNSGQLMEYWTGGHFHAAPHRVRIITEGKEAKDPRQSLVFFINPDGDTDVFPIIPVLPEKEIQFQKFNNQPVNAYKHYQERIENATLY
ncbi:2-oxoglutarate-dependent dioxygenase htyE-like [Bradysia coprophila]|uniref:2-oxoglutarate-dependent dioxygenase htyE-like n=1 Tax=Bradysia coprophila TaxID=38358 RepID=UPI00187DDA3B|nr:2-oxoglutarate-dependent dioxygenase htyE-like [Bradysia coprophila]